MPRKSKRNVGRKKVSTKRKSMKRKSMKRKSMKGKKKIKVVSDLLSSSYGIGALSKKSKDEKESILKDIDDKSSEQYHLDEVFKSDKGLKPKPPKKSRKGKKSPKKKKSEYQIFVSKKLQEYKKLYPNMAQKDKFKKIGKEWKIEKNK